MWWEAHGNSKEMRNESGREEEKSPNMKHCFLSGRARAGINCQWSHFRAMSVYLYWLWTDRLAGASRSEARRASRLGLAGEEPCNDTGFMYGATVSGDLVWGGPGRARCSQSKGHRLQPASSVPVKPARTERECCIIPVRRWAQHTLLWLTQKKWGKSEPNEQR